MTNEAQNPEQGTAAWHEARAGCITASRMRDLLWTPGLHFKSGKRKGQPKPPPESRSTYIRQIVTEIITGQASEQVSAKTLEYGKEMEPYAIAAYEAKTGRLVEQCGFIKHAQHSFIGASPDLFVGNDGGGEVKCPMSEPVHTATLLYGLPPDHIEQIQGGLWVTEREWWDFVSFNPKFPPGLDLYVERVYRDDKKIAQLKSACMSAWEEVSIIVSRLRERIAA